MFFCFGFCAGLHGVIFVGGVRVRWSGHVDHTGLGRGLSGGVLLCGVLSVRFVQRLRDQVQHEVSLGELFAVAERLALQVTLDALEEFFGNLECHSPHDLQTFMEVSESTWSHRRNELLSNLSLYYDYEVEYEGRKTTFHILKKLGDYQGIPNKRDASKRNNTYRSKIVEVIKADNVQTASNVARIIKDDSEIQELNHKFGTVQEYTRLRMREMFGKYQNDGGTDGRILEKIWCRLDLEHNCYIPMPEDQIQAFYEFFYAERKASAPIELLLENQ